MSIFDISIFGIHITPTWYGLMYSLSFIIGYEFIKKYWYIKEKDMESFLIYIFLGVILWGRIGYILLYNAPYFLEHPQEMIAIWKGGMSFHGGTIGVIISLLIFHVRKWYTIFDISDPLVTILPIGLWLWRIGNLINKELLGFFPYTWPFAIIKDGTSYFPSPLLEAIWEGGVLFAIMIWWWYWEKKKSARWRYPWYASGIFLLGYGIFRMMSEIFRLPDSQIGYLFGTDWITLGMIYTLPMIISGVIILMITRKLLVVPSSRI